MSMLTDIFMESMPKFFWDNFCYYRIADHADSEKKTGAFVVAPDKLATYNGIKHKNSIFFSPNGDFALAEWVRKKQNAGDIYCCVIDRDDTSQNKVKFREWYEFQPTIVVETYRWYHAYRIFKKPIPYALDGERREELQTNLCNDMWWDHQAKDIARIFRMPGFAYRKWDSDGSYVSDVYEIVENNTYDFEDMYNYYKVKEDIKEEYSFKKFMKKWSDEGIFNKINTDIDVVQVLYKLSWKRKVQWTRILEDGKHTDWYRYHKEGNFLHSFSWKDRPIGPPFAVAKFFLKNDADVFKFFLEEFWLGDKRKYSVEVEKEKEKDVTNVLGEVVNTW